MEKEKTCTGCENQNEEHSLGWEMAKILSKTNKRQTITIFVILGLWFATIVGFVWYLNQYDFSSYEVSTDGGGDAYYSEQSGDGEIIYGTNSGTETDTEKQEKGQG